MLEIDPISLHVGGVQHIIEKLSTRATTLLETSSQLESARKVMGPQSRKSPNFGNFGTPILESRDKMPFGCGPLEEAQSIL